MSPLFSEARCPKLPKQWLWRLAPVGGWKTPDLVWSFASRLTAVWLIVNCKNGISSYEVHRDLGITQKSAWFMDHRIRFALHQGSFENMMSGHVEADESFIGGKSRNMHKDVRARKITGTGGKDKAMVMGILERGKDGKQSKVRTKVVGNRKKHALQSEVRKHVEAGSALYTDDLNSGVRRQCLTARRAPG